MRRNAGVKKRGIRMGTELKYSEKKHIYIIGSYINACSIYKSIRQVDASLPITMLDTTISQGKCLADIVCRDACIIKRRFVKKEDILTVIEDASDACIKKYILFTDEMYIDTIADAIKDGKMINTIAYTGSMTGNEKIFDRFLFYQFIEGLGIQTAKIPRTIEGVSNPFTYFGSVFVIRLRHSWHAGVILPSITIVRDRQQYQETLDRFLKAGLTAKDWCFQELLSIADQHNISVCGWHDANAHQYMVTRKVLQHPPRTGNGDVVENLLVYPQELTQATFEILTAMHYQGPFEMEFVFDNGSNSYKIIELNPRFWMQHGLFEALTDHLLVRRALGEEVKYKTISPEKFQHRYWINANRFWYRLCKGQLSVLRYLGKGTCYPSLAESLHWLPYYKEYTRKQRG